VKLKRIITTVLGLLLFVFAQLYGQEKLTILHWNDFHSFNKPYETKLGDTIKVKVGGYAALSGLINQIKRDVKNVALVHAGDDFQGTPISTITKGMSQIKLLNLVKPDVFSLGNHEFDYGKNILMKQIEKMNFSPVSANIFDKSSGRLFVNPYKIKCYGGLRVGYIGLMSPLLNQLTLRDNIKGLKILDPSVAAQKYITAIKDSVDLIVIVSHMGVGYDEDLAKNISGADIIIGGHSHTALFEPKIVNNIYICQAGKHGKYLGRIDLEFDKSQKKVVNFQSNLIPVIVNKIDIDIDVARVVDSLEQVASKELDKVIGVLKKDWILQKRSESNLGNWQTDVMREYAGTDIAFQNSGGIRKSLMAGKITIRDMWELNPFSNYFGTFELTGAELKKALERNSTREGEFLQVSGLQYKYNPNNAIGERVIEVMVNNQPIDIMKNYSVCTNNFLIGVFYETFRVSPDKKKVKYLPGTDRDIFIEAVKKQKTISSNIEGRIVAIK